MGSAWKALFCSAARTDRNRTYIVIGERDIAGQG